LEIEQHSDVAAHSEKTVAALDAASPEKLHAHRAGVRFPSPRVIEWRGLQAAHCEPVFTSAA
jgi:hypothetical protein